MAHAYKDIETRDLLGMIPIEDVVEYHGKEQSNQLDRHRGNA